VVAEDVFGRRNFELEAVGHGGFLQPAKSLLAQLCANAVDLLENILQFLFCNYRTRNLLQLF